MKKRLLYAFATLAMLLASSGMYATARVTDGGNPPPTCIPTDPACKP